MTEKPYEPSESVRNIAERILGSEKAWKSLYMATWGCIFFYLERDFKGTPLWKFPLPFNLPAAKSLHEIYTPEELADYLRSRDWDFTMGQLQTLFSLLEELVKELCLSECGQEINLRYFDTMADFLTGKAPYNFARKINPECMAELKLAKESRNCFIHHDSKVNSRWLAAFTGARQGAAAVRAGDRLPVSFHQVEEWTDLVFSIVRTIVPTQTRSKVV